MRREIHEHVTRNARDVASSAGATAEVGLSTGGLITDNDAALLAQMSPTMQRTSGADGPQTIKPITGSEDFLVLRKEIRGIFPFLGVATKGSDPATQPANQSPLFFDDESTLPAAARSMENLEVDHRKSGGLTSSNVQ